jgi:hypothetical protein
MNQFGYYTPPCARRWLRDRGIEARLPKQGRRLVIVNPPSETGTTIIERVENDAGRLQYLICPVPR